MSVARAFGKALRAAREAKGMSQEMVAHRSGYHRTYISLLERGLRIPTLETILRLAAILEVPATTLVAEAEKILSQDNSATRNDRNEDR